MAKLQDAPRLASIHLACEGDLHDSFLCKLGRQFLQKYYEIVLQQPWSVVVCALSDDESEIVGFTCNTLDAQKQFRALEGHRFGLLCSMVPALIAK